MKIALIGPGIMPIPPNGWGAVEMLIWDYYTILSKHGIKVDIINTQNIQEIINKVNSEGYDVAHLHYDIFAPIMEKLKCKLNIISSHYPFISHPEKYSQDGYERVLPYIINNKNFYIFASSQNDIDTFVNFGADKNKTFLSKLGVRDNAYSFYENPIYSKTLCFSQITSRKRQSIIQNIEDIDFMGRLDDFNFKNLKNYKGQVEREFLNKEISKYSNFILLSSAENATPLAVKEALICGLGIVASESVVQELDKSLNFITVIPESKILDPYYIKSKIEENKNISIKMRKEIRKYAIETFELENILINFYLKKIKELLT